MSDLVEMEPQTCICGHAEEAHYIDGGAKVCGKCKCHSFEPDDNA